MACTFNPSTPELEARGRSHKVPGQASLGYLVRLKTERKMETREMTQSIRCLLCKQKELSLDPPHPYPCKSQTVVTMHVTPNEGVDRGAKRGNRRIPRFYWPINLAQSMCFKFSERLISKQKRKEKKRKINKKQNKKIPYA